MRGGQLLVQQAISVHTMRMCRLHCAVSGVESHHIIYVKFNTLTTHQQGDVGQCIRTHITSESLAALLGERCYKKDDGSQSKS